jgi:large subunit ribosomal protein L32
MRRSHHALDMIQTTECSNCGTQKLQHHVCASCGHYNGRQVLRVQTAEQTQTA